MRREVEELHRDVADASLGARFEEQAHFRVAEAVDRLHRIADREQRAPVARRPSCRQQLDEPELGVGRVLEFIDQQMIDREVETQQEVARRIGIAERLERGDRQLREVDGAVRGEHHRQLRGGLRQDMQQRGDRRPVRVGEAGSRELAQAKQCTEQLLPVGERIEHGRDFVLEAPTVHILGRHAGALVHRLRATGFLPTRSQSATACHAARSS